MKCCRSRPNNVLCFCRVSKAAVGKERNVLTAHSPFFTLRFPFFILLFLGIMAAAPAMEVQQKLTEMTFEKEAHDWKAERNCRASLEEGVLRVEAVAAARA